jgi:hypothetical protein
MNIKSVTKRLFHCFCIFVDIKWLYFDNIKIVPIFLKTWINLYRNRIEIFGYISRSSNFISNRIYSNQIRIKLYLIGFLCRFLKIGYAWRWVLRSIYHYAECLCWASLCWVSWHLKIQHNDPKHLSLFSTLSISGIQHKWHTS